MTNERLVCSERHWYRFCKFWRSLFVVDLRTLVPNLRTCTQRMFGRKNTATAKFGNKVSRPNKKKQIILHSRFWNMVIWGWANLFVVFTLRSMAKKTKSKNSNIPQSKSSKRPCAPQRKPSQNSRKSHLWKRTSPPFSHQQAKKN